MGNFKSISPLLTLSFALFVSFGFTSDAKKAKTVPEEAMTCVCDPCDCVPCECGFSSKISNCDPSLGAQGGIPNCATTLTTEQTCPQNDKYFQGYIQALIDMNYYEHRVTVAVQRRIVYLYHLPKNPTLCSSIIHFVQNIPGVHCIKLECPQSDEDQECEDEQAKMYPPGRVSGIWMPQQTVLFAPLLADPRQSMYSGAYRFGDRVLGKRGGAVSFGEDFPIYRWRNVGKRCGDVQVGIEGCVFSVFDLTHSTTVLVNADYFVSIPVTYAIDEWSWRFRIYHISSHIGDEYMIEHPDVNRTNLSREAIDVFLSYQWHSWLRLYGGAGYIIHYDKSFPLKRPYVQYGTEFRFFGRQDFCNSLYMQPFLAINIQNAAYNHWNFNLTSSFGIEWSKIQGVGRKVRISVDYHNGFSSDGQFLLERNIYTQIKLAYGF